jgi:hypothetical protein
VQSFEGLFLLGFYVNLSGFVGLGMGVSLEERSSFCLVFTGFFIRLHGLLSLLLGLLLIVYIYI